MSIFKREGSKHWQYKYSIGRQTFRGTTGTADRQAAQEFHDRERAKSWRLQTFREHHISFKQAAVAWWDELASGKRSAYDDRLRLRRIAAFFRHTMIAEIDTPALDRVATALRRDKLAPSTINKYLAVASGILRHASRKGWLSTMPVIPWASVPKSDYQYLTQAEAAALLPLLPPHLRQLAKFSLMTGLRRENATHLEWERVDLARRVCWIKGEDSKNGKPIPIPLNADACTVLSEQLGASPQWCFPYRNKPVMHTTTKAWQRAVKAIGRPEVTWHDLRHTWASWHVQRGTDLRVLMQLGGWSDIKMVLRYAHLSPGFAAPYADNVSLGVADTVSDTARESVSQDRTQVLENMGWLMGLEPTTTGITNLMPRKKRA